MVNIYIAAYRQTRTAQKKFSPLSNSELKEIAAKYAVQAPNYDPHVELNQAREYIGGLWRLVRFFLFLGIGFGVLTRGTFLLAESRGLLSLLSSPSSRVIEVILTGPTIIAGLLALVFVYAESMAGSTSVIQTLNEHLRFGPINYETRNKDQLVGITLWNSSLNGGAAIKLLAVFSVLWLLSRTPYWDPYSAIQKYSEEQIGAMEDSEGYLDAIKHVYRQLRLR
ncbi:hypothetical protein [Halanaeroarchaeum sp. HSR-CO]|uniref:hypothetical protein n=1 Tax=Halanaeroarchaeum sp. HSR-CO TaxID=2866382 RepID=UPI00217DA619|nr:hypothetical protein [Halanaeroarchaeum sp. HSR-CO]